jgi:hypothetical protein
MINNAFYSSLMILVLTISTFLPSNLSALDFSEHFNGAMRVDGESTWIYAEGNFEAGDAEKFERFLDGRGLWRNQRVVLNSGGGSVLEGIMIGQIIRKHEFRTAVAASVVVGEFSQVQAGVCASACVLAFAGGVERGASEGSRVGVHQMSWDYDDIANGKPITIEDLEVNMSVAQRMVGLTLTHFMEMGIDPTIIPLMVGTSADDIRWLTLDELLSTKISFVPSQFLPWMVEPYGNGLVAYSRSWDENKQLTLYCGSNGQMQFLLNLRGSPYGASHSSMLEVERIKITIAGATVLASESNTELNDGALLISGPWHGDLTISGQINTYTLVEVTGAVRDIYSLYYFNQDNFAQTVGLARENCI